MVRIVSAVGVLVGLSTAMLGYYGTNTACFAQTGLQPYCPVGAVCSCPKPLAAYLFAILGGALAAASGGVLVLSFVRPKAAQGGVPNRTVPRTRQNGARGALTF